MIFSFFQILNFKLGATISLLLLKCMLVLSHHTLLRDNIYKRKKKYWISIREFFVKIKKKI